MFECEFGAGRVLCCGAFSLLWMLSGCGDSDDEPTRALDAGMGCQVFVADSLIEHACFHERVGPHVERSAGAGFSVPDISIDSPHTAFHVRLLPREGGGFGGVVTYLPRQAGEYAVFALHGTLRVTDRGATIAAKISHATELCDVLPTVSVFALQPRLHALELESDQADVVLVIESMNEGTMEDNYRSTCTALESRLT